MLSNFNLNLTVKCKYKLRCPAFEKKFIIFLNCSLCCLTSVTYRSFLTHINVCYLKQLIYFNHIFLKPKGGDLQSLTTDSVERLPECRAEDRAGRRRHTSRRWPWSCEVEELQTGPSATSESLLNLRTVYMYLNSQKELNKERLFNVRQSYTIRMLLI